MYVVFLGTGNALPSVERANTALAVAAGRGAHATLIDCGGDPFRNLLRAGVDAARLDDVIITHAHIDHIGGLPSLIESLRIAGRTAPLRIFGNAHVLQVIRGLLEVYAFELTLDNWPFPLTFHEIAAGERQAIGAFQVEVCATEHSVASVGLRLAANGNPQTLLGYTSDSLHSPLLGAIAQDAPLFIAEATYSQGHEEEARLVHHMTITQAATIAAAAHASALALVHLSMPAAREREIRHEAQHHFKGQVIVPHDGQIVEVAPNARVQERTNVRQLP